MLGKYVSYTWQRSQPHQPQKPGEAVVYYFHGLWIQSESWKYLGYSDVLDALATKNPKLPPFTVVSFDTQPMSFFAGPYETWFIKEFIPWFETSRQLCREKKCRTLMGKSMGGYGALKTALKYPHMFGAVAASYPSLLPLNTQDNLLDWYDYFGRHPIGRSKGLAMLWVARQIFPTRASCNSNDPIELVKHFADFAEMPEIYIDSGLKDEFGFWEGYGKFTWELQQRGVSFTSFLDPSGDHDKDGARREPVLKFLADYYQRAYNLLK